MKTTFKTVLALSLAALLALSMIACGDENDSESDKSTTTTTKLTTLGNNNENPDKDNDKNNENKDDTDKDDTNNDETQIKFVSGDEKAAQTTEMGNMVYWYDQNWNGSTVTVTTHTLTDGVYEFAFTHIGSNWFGAQLFMNPVDAANGNEYSVSFKIKSTVDTSITVCGAVYELTADEVKTISYDVTLDMNPASTDYQYGQSAFDVQFGVEDGNIDIVDGTYFISELVLTKK